MVTQTTLDAAQRLHLAATKGDPALAADVRAVLNAFWALHGLSDQRDARLLSLVDQLRGELLGKSPPAQACAAGCAPRRYNRPA